jgi:HEPN domain-containing protein
VGRDIIMTKKPQARNEKMSLAEQVQNWLDIVKDDMEMARISFSKRKYLYTAFFCQQAVEKAFKACIQAKGEFPPKIHTLLALAEKAGLSDSIDAEGDKFLETLTEFAIEARYREQKVDIEARCTKAVLGDLMKKAEEMIAWLSEMSSQLQR